MYLRKEESIRRERKLKYGNLDALSFSLEGAPFSFESVIRLSDLGSLCAQTEAVASSSSPSLAAAEEKEYDPISSLELMRGLQ